MRLLLLGVVRIMALSGRWGVCPGPGEVGGDEAIMVGREEEKERRKRGHHRSCHAKQNKNLEKRTSDRCAADQARVRSLGPLN